MGQQNGFYCSCQQYIDYDEDDTLSVTIRDEGRQRLLGDSAVLMCPKCNKVYVVPIAKSPYSYRVGDSIEVQLKNGMLVEFEVIGLDQDTIVADIPTKARYTFCMKGLYPKPMRFFSGDALEISWKDSYLRNWLNTEFIDLFPDTLKNRIQVVKKLTQPSQQLQGGVETHDRIFLLSPEEVFGNRLPPAFPAPNPQYPAFADLRHRIKFTVLGGALEPANWWLRTMSGRRGPNGPLPNCMGSTGQLGASAGETEFIAPCFCIS